MLNFHERTQVYGHVYSLAMVSSNRDRCFVSTAVTIIVLIGLQVSAAAGNCERHLPTEQSPNIANVSARILSGLPANPSDFGNIVTIAYDTEQGNPDYNCIGSLIAPSWVVTAAQCFISPGRNYVLHGGGNSLSGTIYSIAEVIPHPDWGPETGLDESRPSVHDDIQLVHLQSPVIGSQPASSFTGSLDGTSHFFLRQTDTSSSPEFNFMRINNNSAFVVPPSPMQFLRFKGYGLSERPENNEQPIQEVPRPLTFADLKTTACPSPYRDDSQRLVCTVGDSSCGPCYGDVGGPLYDVDASGTVSVLVGILSFGRNAASDTSTCSSEEPVIYTAVSTYVPWILSTVGDEASEITIFPIPSDGLNDTDLAPESPALPTRNRMSVFVIICLIIAGIVTLLIAILIVVCIIRTRRRWRRHKDGLLAEESFVYGGKVSDASNPFEEPGATENRGSRHFTSAPVKSVHGVRGFFQRKDNTQFSIDGLSSILGSRLYFENAPTWLNNAWERLFRSPSRQDLGSVPSHRGSRRDEDPARLEAPKSNDVGNERTSMSALKIEAQQLNGIRTSQGLEANELREVDIRPFLSELQSRNKVVGQKGHGEDPVNNKFKPQWGNTQMQGSVTSVIAVGGRGPLDEMEVEMERPQSHWSVPNRGRLDDLEELRRVLKERDGRDGRRDRQKQNTVGNSRQNTEKEARDPQRTHVDLHADLKARRGYERESKLDKDKGVGNGYRGDAYMRAGALRTETDSRLGQSSELYRDANMRRMRVFDESLEAGRDGEGEDMNIILQEPVSKVSFDKGFTEGRYDNRDGDWRAKAELARGFGVTGLRGEGRDVTDVDVNGRSGFENAGRRAGSAVSFEKIDIGRTRPDLIKARTRRERVDVTNALADGAEWSGRIGSTKVSAQGGEVTVPKRAYLHGRGREDLLRTKWQRDSRSSNTAKSAKDLQTAETEVVGEGLGFGSGREY